MFREIIDFFIGTEAQRQAEEQIQRERALHNAVPVPVRLGGLLGLIQRLEEIRDAEIQSGGGAGSRRR